MSVVLIPCTVGILTFNNEATLNRALDSVEGFAEVIISDGGSTDETLSIARSRGVQILSQDTRLPGPVRSTDRLCRGDESDGRERLAALVL